MKVPFSPTFSSTFVVVCVQHDSHSNKSDAGFNVGLICISFMARDMEHFFMCFLAIWTSSFEKFLFSSFAPFLHWVID
jgi:hypothetical protein